jgi:chloramphenicol-sensitive protein RarD
MPQTSHAGGDTRAGLAAAASAYLLWGFLPVYWKALGHVPATAILGHRIVWSVVFTATLLVASGRWPEATRAMMGAGCRWHVLSAALLAVNWLTFLWAVNSGRVLECSLGYFLNPLLSVFLGAVLLGERLRRGQWLAILLAAAATVNELLSADRLPWVALALALSFGLYGLIRKSVSTAALPGLFIEMAVLALPALGWIAWHEGHGGSGLVHAGTATRVLLVASGIVTALPLTAFAYGVRRLQLVTIGVLQYITPTGMLLLGALAYGEPLSPHRLITFALIWCGVGCYTLEAVLFLRLSER